MFRSGSIIPDQSVRTGTRIAFAFVTVMAAATVLSFVHRFLPVVLLDDMRRDIQVSDLEFSSLQTAFAITYAVTTITSGWMADRSNRRNLLVVGVVACDLAVEPRDHRAAAAEALAVAGA